MTGRNVARALLRTLQLYPTLGVVYIAVNSVTHPRTLALHVTHLASWPSEGTFGVACLIASLVSTLLIRILDFRDLPDEEA